MAENPLIAQAITKDTWHSGLYICATPIGNLSDLSIRCLALLSIADWIACEDTRTTKKLLQAYGITCPKLITCNGDKEQSIAESLILSLHNGTKGAFVSDAGMPLVNDPGAILVNTARQQNIPIFVLPGACAVSTALVYSGYNGKGYSFYGYFPNKTKEAKELITNIQKNPHWHVFFVAPHDCLDVLRCLIEHSPKVFVSICRELTKAYQNIYQGYPSQVLQQIEKLDKLGEIVIILCFPQVPAHNDFQDLFALLDHSKPTQLLAKTLAEYFDLSKNLIYSQLIAYKRSKESKL